MAKLDFRLEHLYQQSPDTEDRVHVLVEFRKDLAEIEQLGFRQTSIAGSIAAGSVSISSLEKLNRHPDVVMFETSSPLKNEVDLSAIEINLVDRQIAARGMPSRGKDALIGFIDSGFDLTHPCFFDESGETRILSAWDQLGKAVGTAPAPFGYGVEHLPKEINQHVEVSAGLIIKNNKHAGAHGTYVAGIAAGKGDYYNVFEGIAPEAKLIFVSYRNDVPVGGSAFLLDAICYIKGKAKEFGLPVVINISQGDNLGGHDGKSLLERAIDNVVATGELLVVTSAGNERGGFVGHHSSGKVQPRQQLAVPFKLMVDAEHSVDDDAIEIWYGRNDRLSVAIRNAEGEITDFCEPGKSATLAFAEGNQAKAYSSLRHPSNSDNHVGIVLEKHHAWRAGNFELVLRPDVIVDGRCDIWVDRPNAITVIGFEAQQTPSCTITLPGNARSVITVGGFISRAERQNTSAEAKGALAPGSSIGPTRDGRQKPDLTAPSQLVMAPRIRLDSCPPCYDLVAGTSMAAPHVSGLIALLWSLWPKLPAEEIRRAILATALSDSFTGPTPNDVWGNGKLNAMGAYYALRMLEEKGKTDERKI